MAGLKEIKRRIRSVKNTRKITYAMKLVSAAKLRKAQDAVHASRQYTDALNRLVGDLLSEFDLSEYSHPLMEERAEIQNIALVIVGGSRGLCGAFNTNLSKKVDALIGQFSREYRGATVRSVVLGKKPTEHLRKRKYAVLKSYIDLPEEGKNWPIEEVCRIVEDDFVQGNVDLVYVVYTQFASAMSQKVEVKQLLPLSPSAFQVTSNATSAEGGTTLFEPSPEAVFRAIVPRVVRTMVLQGALDTKASEHGSRMVAMDAATKNAGELAHKLTLKHNKLRQGAITAELLDIIGGAEALS